MNQALWLLVAWVALGGIVDLAYSWEYLDGGSVSWAVGGWYRDHWWVRPALLAGSILLLLLLDWHFATYRSQ